jgi:DNA (cytosine-5)-methyltransferase 1
MSGGEGMNDRPRLLDLFCGAGGAAVGYHRAGFDVVGVDIAPQPRYPFEFHQADALEFPLDGYDAIHASPPCQDHMRTPLPQAKRHGTGWLLAATRDRLLAQSAPWVIENVPGAPMRVDYRLCGCRFGLATEKWELRRVRWFEVSWIPPFVLEPPCVHSRPAIAVVGNGQPSWYRQRWTRKPDGKPDYVLFRRTCQEVMGIDWMTRDELSQAIPPAYTEHIGAQLLVAVKE